MTNFLNNLKIVDIMIKKNKVSFVIPTYNESKNISTLVEQLFAVAKKENIDLELVIVDDNSPDKTGEIAEQLAKKYPLKVVHRSGKLGLGTAVVAGFKAASGNILGVMDADLSHPPEVLPALVKPIIEGGYDLTIGSRYVKGGGVEVWPFHRKIISLGATYLAYPLTKIKDPVSGLFCLKKEVIENVDLGAKGYKIGLEIFVKGKYKKYKEVPYIFRNRIFGESKIGPGEFTDYIKNILRLAKYKLIKK